MFGGAISLPTRSQSRSVGNVAEPLSFGCDDINLFDDCLLAPAVCQDFPNRKKSANVRENLAKIQENAVEIDKNL